MLEIGLQAFLFFYLSEHLLQQKYSRFSYHLVPEGLVDLGEPELSQVLVCYLVLVAVSQQKMQNLFCANF